MHAINGRKATSGSENQLLTIRDLMLTANARGVWLTLEEIAEFTAAGEASISAQLRHLRKPQYGRYQVEKRRRQSSGNSAPSSERDAGLAGTFASRFASTVWEYRVWPASVPSIARTLGLEAAPGDMQTQ